MKLTIHLHVLTRLKIHGVIPHFSVHHHSLQLNHGDSMSTIYLSWLNLTCPM